MVEASQIPVFRPLLESEELDAATRALELGWLGMGSYVGEFEEAVKQVAGADGRHVVAVSTGHAALHLALLVCGVGPGDEVITPSLNNIADLQAIQATGAEAVFCDVLDDTLCIDPRSAAQAVGPRTKAIIATDYFCHLIDYPQLELLRQEHGLRLIHDAAHSFGSRLANSPVGSFADMTVFSFDAVKTVTCIDGGAIVVSDAADAAVLREMRLIGMGQDPTVMYRNQRAWNYDVVRLGYRYHLANLHAALGLSQINKLGYIAESRRAACLRYNERLASTPSVRTPYTDFNGVVPFLYYVRVPAPERQSFRDSLAAEGIDTGIHWQPAHHFTLFSGCRSTGLEVTEQAGAEIVSLPLHSGMTTATVDRICDVVLRWASGLPGHLANATSR